MKSFDFKGKRVLIRVDFNVPQDTDLKVTDNTRIKAALPTIQKVLEAGGVAVLMSHLGRPKGSRNERMSLQHLVAEVEALAGAKVHFVSDCIGETAKRATLDAKAGEIVLLENLRFYAEEESGDEKKGPRVTSTGLEGFM